MPRGIQYFRDDIDGAPYSEFCFDWVKKYREEQVEKLSDIGGSDYGLAIFTENAKLELLARRIHRKRWLPISKYVPESFFAENFIRLIDIYSRVGSYSAIVDMVDLLLNGATASFDNSTPGVLGVSVTVQTETKNLTVVDNADGITKNLTTDNGASNLTVQASTSILTPYEISVILQEMQINGIRLEITS